jgi:hypothetical protein
MFRGFVSPTAKRMGIQNAGETLPLLMMQSLVVTAVA